MRTFHLRLLCVGATRQERPYRVSCRLFTSTNHSLRPPPTTRMEHVADQLNSITINDTRNSTTTNDKPSSNTINDDKPKKKKKPRKPKRSKQTEQDLSIEDNSTPKVNPTTSFPSGHDRHAQFPLPLKSQQELKEPLGQGQSTQGSEFEQEDSDMPPYRSWQESDRSYASHTAPYLSTQESRTAPYHSRHESHVVRYVPYDTHPETSYRSSNYRAQYHPTGGHPPPVAPRPLHYESSRHFQPINSPPRRAAEHFQPLYSSSRHAEEHFQPSYSSARHAEEHFQPLYSSTLYPDSFSQPSLPQDRHPSTFFRPSYPLDRPASTFFRPSYPQSHYDSAPYTSAYPQYPIPQTRLSTHESHPHQDNSGLAPSQVLDLLASFANAIQQPAVQPPIALTKRRVKTSEERVPTLMRLPRPRPRSGYLSRSNAAPRRLPQPKSLLIILDMNGVLVFRKRRTKTFTPRPNLYPFLDYLFANHHVMIWSSGMPENVERTIREALSDVQREKLLAVWSRDKLRIPGPFFGQKVQVYKQLSWIWQDPDIQRHAPQGGWNQSNTVLIDDSLEKAAAEPHNLIEVDEFDNSLAQKNNTTLLDVIVHLEHLRYYEDVSAENRKTPFVIRQQ
jgi:hypothetical protein